MKAVGKVYQRRARQSEEKDRGDELKGARVTVCLACIAALGLSRLCPGERGRSLHHRSNGDEVSVLDLSDRSKSWRAFAVCGKPAGIAMARDGQHRLVTSTEGKFVSVIDTASRKIKAQKSRFPIRRSASPPIRRAAFIYVSGFYKPRIYKIDRRNRRHRRDGRGWRVAVRRSGVARWHADRDADRDDNHNLYHRREDLCPQKHRQGRRASVWRDYRCAGRARRMPRMSKATTFPSSISRLESCLEPWRSVSGLMPLRWRMDAAFPATNMAERFRFSILRRSSRSERIFVGDYPGGNRNQRRRRTVYVVNWFSNEVWAIDAETLTVTAKMPAGDGPRAFGTFLRETM